MKRRLAAAVLAVMVSLPAQAEDSTFKGKMFERKITFSASNIDLRDALRMVVKKGGLNAAIDDSIRGNVNVDYSDVELGQAIQSLTLLGGVHCYARDGVLVFVGRDEAKKRGLTRLNSQVFKVRNGSAAKIAETINAAIFGLTGSQVSSQNGSSASPDMRSNSLLIVGSPFEIERAAKMIQDLDVPLTRKVIKLNYANAVQVASILNSSIFNYGPISSQNGSSNNTTNGNSTGGTMGGTDQVVADVESIRDSAASSVNPNAQLGTTANSVRTTTLSTQRVEVNYRGPVVVPDTRTNSVVIVGTSEHIAQAEAMLAQLDRQLPQVAIDVELYEVTERGVIELGTSISGQTGQVQAGFDSTNGVTITNSTALPVTQSLRVQLNALVTQRMAKLLAKPRLLATDNTESQLEIVDEIIKGTRITNQGLTVGNQNLVVVEPIFGISGIILNILPKIGNDGQITLRLHPTVSNVRETMRDSQNNLITLLSRRDLFTQQIRVKDGETLSIGGITQNNQITSKTKIPLLGDIPILGGLFSWTNSENAKTDLVILMTPKIVTTAP